MTEVIVHAPPGTSQYDCLFLAGNSPILGNWRADGIALTRRDDGVYQVLMSLREDVRLHFLITRGTWRSQEATPAGTVIAPRPLTAGARHEIAVEHWGRHAIHYHHDFYSHILGNHRTLTVYVPPGFGLEERHYPVFYLQDGQNVFDAWTSFAGVCWSADETAERLIRNQTIPPMLLVGIANTPQRLEEYGPTARRNHWPGRDFPYARFLVEEVKPYIDQTYPTLTNAHNTAIGGSSMGGLISLFMCLWYPEVFGRCAALSPSLWWDQDLLIRILRERPKGIRHTKFWIDTGDQEGQSVRGRREQVRRTRLLFDLLSASGLHRGQDVRYLEVHGGEHNEAAWADRFDQVLTFLFGKSQLMR